eukprot:CAMPEP_0204360670 /NCGR_PEP_ID=MMETSP0469-20131031/38217_1 /ASSEMBLY_ACC=CAM_ASM_000384 /TAXON_ID=2969 /ORGANISM="Oxyrrhis marina" /LENGTH=317 /DNA_ID=CAMNT_0051348941 /DNA_START=11 /DNA_END=964 /DNA_ORIENTATION=+
MRHPWHPIGLPTQGRAVPVPARPLPTGGYPSYGGVANVIDRKLEARAALQCEISHLRQQLHERQKELDDAQSEISQLLQAHRLKDQANVDAAAPADLEASAEEQIQREQEIVERLASGRAPRVEKAPSVKTRLRFDGAASSPRAKRVSKPPQQNSGYLHFGRAIPRERGGSPDRGRSESVGRRQSAHLDSAPPTPSGRPRKLSADRASLMRTPRTSGLRDDLRAGGGDGVWTLPWTATERSSLASPPRDVMSARQTRNGSLDMSVVSNWDFSGAPLSFNSQSRQSTAVSCRSTRSTAVSLDAPYGVGPLLGSGRKQR